ncbi:hypothetical protein FB381_4297 [Nocardioides albertanoniae]|uniref:Uncharacterized protein n=1 Tax=Nocardioides albertanoniae TaxID=1175486 RepID=A0A543ACR6_9ACTN|nr:hypothetical protein [Nocardioides albertanoniae]TQL70367.1 hypothetical protein FB381_4297 [Nocardioides albertanoniae]
MSTVTMHANERTWRGSAVLRSAPWVAGAWSLAFGALTGLALIGRTPDPWVPEAASALGGLSGGQMSALIASAALVTLVAGAFAVRSRGAPERGDRPGAHRWLGWLLIGVGLVVALVISDVRALSFLGYLPQTLMALIDVGPAAGHINWELVLGSGKALAHVVGGLAIVGSGIRVLQRSEQHGRLDWSRWARWGRPAVTVAIIIPMFYAVTRMAWAIDVPFGIRPEMLDELGEGRWAGLGLALSAVAGCVLTWGLVARWGEVFWRWVPGIGGRSVPVAMALVPGFLVAAAVTSAGLSFWRMAVADDLWTVPGTNADWAAWAPEMLWPLWGVALSVACLAYLGRRTAQVR